MFSTFDYDFFFPLSLILGRFSWFNPKSPLLPGFLFVSAPLLMAALTASTSWAGSGKRPKRNQFTGCGQSQAEILGLRFHFHRC